VPCPDDAVPEGPGLLTRSVELWLPRTSGRSDFSSDMFLLLSMRGTTCTTEHMLREAHRRDGQGTQKGFREHSGHDVSEIEAENDHRHDR
jgi:hypothetical protein